MSIKRTATVLIFFSLALAAFTASMSFAQTKNDFAAIVNGEKIPLNRYERAVAAAKKDFLKQRQDLSTPETQTSMEAAEEKSIETAVLYQLIDSVLVEQGSEKEGIIITEQEIRDKIEELKEGFPSPQEFHRSVAEQNMTIEDLKVNIKRQLMVDKIKETLKKDIIVLDDEIKEFYDRNIDIFIQKEKVKLRDILVSSFEGAEKVFERLNAGEDFAKLAGKSSLDTITKGHGGDMGFVERGEIDGALAEIAFILKPGHISPIIETDHGYYIIKVEDRIPGKTTTVEKARNSIERFLLDEKATTEFQKWLDNQRINSDLVINEKIRPFLI